MLSTVQGEHHDAHPSASDAPRHSEEVLAHTNSNHAASSSTDDNSSDTSDHVQQRERHQRPGPVKRLTSQAMIQDADRTELVRIATALSRRHSVATGDPSRIHTLATNDENNPALDPTSQQFDLHKWVQNFIQTLQDQGVTAKRTGAAWKNLNVSGSGAALQVQGTVGSWLLSPLRLGELFSFGKKEPRQILRSFDGLIQSGELLIVLGRPGSGCSTLLKTLCAELRGLSVGEESKIHYNGIPQELMKKEFKGEAVYNQEVRICPLRKT